MQGSATFVQTAVRTCIQNIDRMKYKISDIWFQINHAVNALTDTKEFTKRCFRPAPEHRRKA